MLWDDNTKVADWYASELRPDGTLREGGVMTSHIAELMQHQTVERVRELAEQGSETAFEAISGLIDVLDEAQRSELAAMLSQPR